MKKIVYLPDLHIRDDEPFFMNIVLFLKWFVEQSEINNSNVILVQGGDTFHKSRPSPQDMDIFWIFLNKLKVHKFYIIVGNHDWDDEKKIFSIHAFRNHEKIEVVDQPKLLNLWNLKSTFLPWNFKMKKLYGQRDISVNPDDTNLIFYHFPDETIGGNGAIDLSKFKGHRVGGDIHVTPSSHYPGVAYPTKIDEAGNHNSLFCINENEEISFIKVPKTFDYFRIKYSDEIEFEPEKIKFLSIEDAPSYELARDKFKDYHIHSIKLSIEKTLGDFSSRKERASIEQYVDDYVLFRKVNNKVKEKLKSVLVR